MVRHLKITGRVQDVGFRYALCEIARVRHITGWVRNRRDGSVEAIVSDTPEAVEHIVAWARRGPPAAEVHHVEIVAEAGSEFSRFDMLPTE